MSADYTAYESILKEVWTSKTLEEQLYQGNPFLEAMEKRKPAISIGDTAQTPIHTGRSGGYSVKPRSGGALNAPDSQKVNAASWVWTHHYFQIQIESSTIDETANNSLAAAEVVDTEVTGAVDDLRKQITRQFVGGDGTALIAPVTPDGSTTVVLDGDGYDALVRGWLGVGSLVDIGTDTDEQLAVEDGRIVSVDVDPTTPTITLDKTCATTAQEYVSIAGARSGTTSYEANGLRNKLFAAGVTLNTKKNLWRTGDGRSGTISTNRRAGKQQSAASSQHWPRPNARGGRAANGMGGRVGAGQKPRGAATGRAKGDWCCPDCSNVNYARRTV